MTAVEKRPNDALKAPFPQGEGGEGMETVPELRLHISMPASLLSLAKGYRLYPHRQSGKQQCPAGYERSRSRRPTLTHLHNVLPENVFPPSPDCGEDHKKNRATNIQTSIPEQKKKV